MWGIDIDELFVAHMKKYMIRPSAIAININNCLTFDILNIMQNYTFLKITAIFPEAWRVTAIA